MTTYRYKGMTSGGAPVEGVVEAFDKQDAVIRAKENCRVVLSVEPVAAGKVMNLLNADIGMLLTGGSVKNKTLALLCSQLAIELKAGLPLVSALRLVAEQERDKTMKTMLDQVAEDVQAGNGLADSFSLRCPNLPRTFIETIRAGEESGMLDESFERLRSYYENAAAVGSRVTSALVYPAMLICVAVIVVAVIMLKAVPVFEKAFAGEGNVLPLPTRILISISNFMVDKWLLLLVVMLMGALGAILYRKTDHGRHLFARMSLMLPVIGPLNRMHGAARFSSTFSTMLRAGLPLVQACRITADTIGNLLIREDIDKALTAVMEGNRLSDGLNSSPWFPALLKEMVTVGEETGKLEETLDVVSAYYSKEVDVAVKRALDILNPCITILLALLVTFILLSVYLPIFSMY